MGNIALDRIDRGNPFSLFGRNQINKTERAQKKSRTEQVKELEHEPAGQAHPAHTDLDEQSALELKSNTTAEGVRDQLKKRGLDLNGAEMLASKVLKEGAPPTEAALQNAADKVSNTQQTVHLSQAERSQLIQDIQTALKASKKEAQGLNGQGGVGATEGTSRDMQKHVDAFHSAVSVALKTAEQSSRVIKMHLKEIEKRNDTVRKLLDLADLMTKYESCDSLCLSEPESTDMEKDFNRMQELIFVAKEAGINWDCKGGWAFENKTDYKRFTQGLSSCVSALQSQNKVKDLEMQQAVQAFQALILLCTTLLLLASQTKKSIVQNITR